MTNFRNINYLKNGNQRQIAAFKLLSEHHVLSDIAEFDPILVGTIPINIDIESSDLDIICYWKDKSAFIKKLLSAFGDKTRFLLRETTINDKETVVANFKIADFEIEIFGQNIPTKNQNGYKHMVIEHQILQSKNEDFRLKIIQLKKEGYKTEPAFGILLGFKNDPYLELMEYKFQKIRNHSGNF